MPAMTMDTTMAIGTPANSVSPRAAFSIFRRISSSPGTASTLPPFGIHSPHELINELDPHTLAPIAMSAISMQIARTDNFKPASCAVPYG
jgi:hypothetical protein